MPTPRVAAIHDMSGFGRCSLTVAIPVLSAMGVQCCPLPTAYLSTHTGGFTGYTFLDMTDELPKTAAHWAELGIMPPLGCRIKGKRNKNAELSRRSLEIIDGLRESVLDGVKEESHEDHH